MMYELKNRQTWKERKKMLPVVNNKSVNSCYSHFASCPTYVPKEERKKSLSSAWFEEDVVIDSIQDHIDILHLVVSSFATGNNYVVFVFHGRDTWTSTG